jgi:hypothetical protein
VQEQQRVEVVPALAQSPVQARRHRATGVAGDQGADRLSGRHLLPGVDLWRDRLVRGPQPARVVDADHAEPGHRPGERHDTGAGGVHRGARGTGEVDAAVPGQPRARRWLERAGHPRDAGQRPPERARRGCRQARRGHRARRRGRRHDRPSRACRGCRRHQRQRQQNREQSDQPTHHDRQRSRNRVQLATANPARCGWRGRLWTTPGPTRRPPTPAPEPDMRDLGRLHPL